MRFNNPTAALRHYVTGAIDRGETSPIEEIPAMQTYIETQSYIVSRDRFGHYEIRAKDDARSVYLRGDDSVIFESDIAHCPAKMLDAVISQYDDVLA